MIVSGLDSFDLLDIEDEVEEEKSENDKKFDEFKENLEGIERLWRLADTNEPNFFTLRTLKGKLEETISLMDILPEFIELNKHIPDLFDLFFGYMVRCKKKRKIPKHLDEIKNYKSMYIEIQTLINMVRSTPDFLNKISYIKITPGQEEKPFCHHWDLKYTDPNYDKDNDLIDLLSACCVHKAPKPKDMNEYIDMIFSNEIYDQHAEVVKLVL